MMAHSMQLGRHVPMTSPGHCCSFTVKVQRPGRRQRGIAYRTITSAVQSTAKFFVGGNWKANGTLDSVAKLVKDLNSASIPTDVDVVCAPPFIYLDMVQKNLSPRYQVAAQNCWTTKNGAYTGEVTAEMIKDLGLNWVILGHSERRALCGESNDIVGKKVAYALGTGLSVIACIGETLDQRNNGSMFDVLDAQLQAVADNVTDWRRVVVAYEPVWAIGTGVVATPAQAQEVHQYLRQWIAIKVSPSVASGLRIIYGGSVTDSNCSELGTQSDIDGFLVGGASLKGASFATICNTKH